MRFVSIALALLAVVLWIFGISQAMEPSAMPLATVIGSLAIPALVTWWARVTWNWADKKEAEQKEPSEENPVLVALGVGMLLVVPIIVLLIAFG